MLAPVDHQTDLAGTTRNQVDLEGAVCGGAGVVVRQFDLGGVEPRVVLGAPGVGLVVEDEALSIVDRLEPEGVCPRKVRREVVGRNQCVAGP